MTKLSIDALDVLSAAPEFDISFADFFLRYAPTAMKIRFPNCTRSVQEKFVQASEQSHKGREFTNAVREVRNIAFFPTDSDLF